MSRQVSSPSPRHAKAKRVNAQWTIDPAVYAAVEFHAHAAAIGSSQLVEEALRQYLYEAVSAWLAEREVQQGALEEFAEVNELVIPLTREDATERSRARPRPILVQRDGAWYLFLPVDPNPPHPSPA